MAIYYNEKNKQFHLQTKQSSYILKVNEANHLVHGYYGSRIEELDNYDSFFKSYGAETGQTIMYTDNPPYSMLHTLYEYPFYGKGDFREPAVTLRFTDGSSLIDLKYKTHVIKKGKYELEGMPSSYSNDKNVDTLVITLVDNVRNLEIELYYGVFNDSNIITRATRIINKSNLEVEIDKVMSMSLDHFESDFIAITLDGAWTKERHPSLHSIDTGVFYIDSKRGASSSTFNPFLAIKKIDTTEHTGECYGFSLVYSGDHRFSIEKNTFGLLRIQCGINPFDFRWYLKENESFTSPEAVLTYSNEGLNKMSQNFHNFINNNIIDENWKFKERPILVNNWEATYFKFNTSKLLSIAKEGSKLGAELFVLDDGWFGHRNNDKSSLGDWFVNNKKLKGGLKHLIRKINKMGLKFGIWVEPEMISIDSELYKKHPDWLIKHPLYDVSLGRHQVMLDLANKEVVDYLFKTLSSLFIEYNIEYVKWDFNREISDIYSPKLNNKEQKAYVHRYYIGYYNLVSSLTKSFPNILFEGCASGGGRFDMGILRYFPQVWCSDNQDPYERQLIQYGTSYVYPQSTIGAHVAAKTNHQIFRRTSLETKFNVAAFGLLGYELDLSSLSKIEKTSIKNQIQYYKENRKLLQFGKFYRTLDPFTSNNCGFEVLNSENETAILGNYQTLAVPYPKIDKLNLYGLNTNKYYHISNRDELIDIKTFGTLINYISPIKFKEDRLLQNVVSKIYKFKTENESIDVSGKQLLNWGFYPKSQFTGSGLNENVRVLGDFGSRLYKIESKEAFYEN